MLPIMLVCIAYILGIIVGLYFYCIAPFCIVMYMLLKRKSKKLIIICCFIFLFGLIYCKFTINKFDTKYLNGSFNDEIIIISDLIEKERVDSFICKNKIGDKFILYVSKNSGLEYGMKITAIGEFELPQLNRNKGGYNYRRYLNSQNIYGVIYCKSFDIIELPSINIIHSLKKSIETCFFKLLPKEYVGILEGMIIGDTSYISDDVKQNFKKCGITHLLAVSGSNVAFILILCKFLFEKIFGRNVSNIITVFFIIIFTFLSGVSASVVRASIMAIIIILAEFLIEKPNTYASLSFSAIIILIYNPVIIFDVGFILSYAGTLGIIIYSKRIKIFLDYKIKFENTMLNYFKDIFSVTLSAQIVTVPIIIYYFNTFSVFSLFVNIIVLPITGYITIIGILTYFASFFFMPIAKILSYIIYSLLFFLLAVSEYFSKISFSTIILPTYFSLFTVLGFILAYLVINLRENKDYKFYVCFIILVYICIFFVLKIPHNYLKVNMIDVNQGDCIYIETPNKKSILIDSGGSEGSDYDIGEKVLLPYFLDMGRMKIDYCFISHMHEDHVEGILTLMDYLEIGKVFIGRQNNKNSLYNELLDKARDRNVKIEFIDDGDIILIDDVEFRILLSLEDMTNMNNTSVMMKMIYGNTSMLFTGDAEVEEEEYANDSFKSNILKVAHHGSDTSTSDEFLNLVSPDIALISVGFNNKFGHPKKEVIERLEKKNINIFRTDLNGEINLKIYKNGIIKVSTMY